MKTAAQFIVELLRGLISGNGDAGLMSALIPVSDPRMAGFQRRSFRTDFYAAIQQAGKGKFEDIFCRPAWLNVGDFDKLAKASGIKSIPRKFDGIRGLAGAVEVPRWKRGNVSEHHACLGTNRAQRYGSR